MSLKRFSLFALALTSSCGLLAPQGPSKVGRGEYYAAGKPEFDSFFIELHQKQVELLTAPNEPDEVRKNLAQALGLAPDASDDSVRERLAQELKKLAAHGLHLRLEVPEASVAVDASATLYSSDGTTSTVFRRALPEQATRLLRSRNRMLATRAALERLRVAGITLDSSINPAFRPEGPWKRAEVRKNLDDGQTVITLMIARAQDVADLDQKLLSLLSVIATTDASLGRSSAYDPAPGEGATRSDGRRLPTARVGAAAKPSPASKAGAARPPAAKAQASRGSDEGAPTAKPTQGTAPAEIEP